MRDDNAIFCRSRNSARDRCECYSCDAAVCDSAFLLFRSRSAGCCYALTAYELTGMLQEETVIGIETKGLGAYQSQIRLTSNWSICNNALRKECHSVKKIL